MNQGQFIRFLGQLKNTLKSQWGKLTDDDIPQIEGDLDKFNSAIETRYGEMKGEVSKWANRRNALIITFLVGLAITSVTTSLLAETRPASEAEARKYGVPMVWVSDGAFTMGSPEGRARNQPPHEAYLNAFYIDQFEVTTARYAKFLEATGQGQQRLVPKLWEQVNLSSDGDRPVMGVTWKAADAG